MHIKSKLLLFSVALFALVRMPACELDKELSPEQMCQQLAECGDPIYNDALQCPQIVNSELMAYPDCELLYENLLESRLDYFCAGDEDEIHFFDNHESLLAACHESSDDAKQIEDEFDNEFDDEFDEDF